MHAIWSGSISFGLVSIPVKLVSGTVEVKPGFNLIRKSDGCPIKYTRVCREDGKEVSMEEIVKGYQYKEGDYVLLEPEDFEAANIKKTHTIEIEQFVKAEEVNSIFFEKPYYLEPEKSGLKAYSLLCEALKETKMVGVGEFVLRNKEALAIIKPYGNLIVLEKLRYAEDIRDPHNLKLPDANLVSKEELKEGINLIKKMTKKFKPDEFHDNYIDELKKIIDAKIKGKKVVTPKVSKKEKPEKIVDIMSLLKESIKKQAS
ncbi:Ku protein (plasmid) [Legionella adelaidensis]|uniref:Non-homologous end joining protein Ku n=1 Tax=Legionella adelaidensis TaxID=45056 RepID=A0A0W0R1E2_9GAMM|nr:Ku protein [Legionella adelaidensis]KTC64814.1 putative DNA repair protein YkoV [Legionella adelaidensis]VEH86196.1 Ku protein [Legionella adelaidensis]